MSELLQPKEVSVKKQDGSEKTFVLSKFPAIQGREIVTQYPLSAIPKLGDYKVNEQIMHKLMSFVGVPMPDGSVLRLTTPTLIDNHVGDWECLARLEAGMIEYNVSFFGSGKSSLSLEAIIQKARVLITKILTDSSVQSALKAAQHSKN